MMKGILRRGVVISWVLGFCSFARAQPIAHRPWFSFSHHPRPSESLRQAERARLAQITPLPSPPPTVHQIVEQRTDLGDKVTEEALRYKGTRYRFGGDSERGGFDCSGLVRRVYYDLKSQKLPHAASALYRLGKPVPLNNLRPGDLVFFRDTYRRGISHVGIYAGHNEFIHASNRRYGVTVTALSDPYFQLHYAGARRLY